MTIIGVELHAVLDALALATQEREKEPEDGTIYYRGTVRSELAGRDYSIVVTCAGAAGNLGAASAARNLIDRYRPRALLLTGIAAGVRGKVRIGDVVFSDRVVSYEPAALVRAPDGTSTSEPRPEIDRTPHTILQDVVNYRQERQRLLERFLRTGGIFPTPEAGKEDEYRQYVASGVEMRIGTIASGEKLLRDPSKLHTLRSGMHGKTEVGEMEAAGLVEACRRGSVPWLVIRGISDFGDEFKNDRFHELAARAAAAVLADFLEFGLDLGGGARAPVPSTERPTLRDRLGRTDSVPGSRMRAFVLGCPVDRDEDFVGRNHEQSMVMKAIEEGQPVQILGESLMGKTSLLRWIQRHALPSRPVVWLDPTRGLSPVSMMRAIADALDNREQVDVLRRPGASIEDAMVALDALDPFVLLIDDADTLATLGKGFDVEFFNTIRSLVQRRRLTWVSASHRSLYGLFKEKGLTSAFLNDARKIWMGPLDEQAATALARQISTSQDEIDIILRQAGGVAYCLQWFGDCLSRQEKSLEQVCDAFATEMESLFQMWWASLNAHERQAMKRCAASAVRVESLDDRTRRQLRALVDRGFLVEHNDSFLAEGLAFREFVQNVE